MFSQSVQDLLGNSLHSNHFSNALLLSPACQAAARPVSRRNDGSDSLSRPVLLARPPIHTKQRNVRPAGLAVGDGKAGLSHSTSCSPTTELTLSAANMASLSLNSGKTCPAGGEMERKGSPDVRGILWHRENFVVDASNPTQVSSSCIQLLSVLSAAPLASVPVLVLFNKIDLPCYMSLVEMKSLFRMQDIVSCATQPITMLETSARDGTGLAEVLQWLRSALKEPC
uniref:ADP-ribosylation factor-like protein 16 n=1 Tax=Serinus canaria TaxID=9135 RepID=A0A8C9NAQ8_SERCA